MHFRNESFWFQQNWIGFFFENPEISMCPFLYHFIQNVKIMMQKGYFSHSCKKYTEKRITDDRQAINNVRVRWGHLASHAKQKTCFILLAMVLAVFRQRFLSVPLLSSNFFFDSTKLYSIFKYAVADYQISQWTWTKVNEKKLQCLTSNETTERCFSY